MSEGTGDEHRASSPVGSPSYARAEIPVEDIIDAASRLQADVVRDHRKDLARTHRLCNKLVAELEAHTDAIDVIKAEIAAVTAGDKTDKRKRVLDRAVSHTTRAGSMRALAGAQKELVALERQAFGLDEDDAGQDADFMPIEERLKVYAREKAMAEAGDKVVEIGPPLQPTSTAS